MTQLELDVPPEKKTEQPRKDLARVFMLGGLALGAASLWLSLSGREPFHTWFYTFAWWSYIAFVDGWVYRRRGESLLLSYPGRFAFLSAWSVVFWTVFELLNLRLGNWSYWGVPAEAPLRWIGYTLGFATVIPALFETADLIQSAGIVREARVPPLGWKTRVEGRMMMAGGASLVLAMAWPPVFFPLVWVAFILLLEPLNERFGAASLLSEWRSGLVTQAVTLMAAGFLCGMLWEALNAVSGAHWTYAIPFVGGAKIFEMPVLGYLWFPVFALEAYVASALAVSVWDRSSVAGRAALAASAALFVASVYRWIDHLTVKGITS